MQPALAQALADALARRAARHTGPARRLIDARLAALPVPPQPQPQPQPAPPAPAPGPLAALLAEHAHRARPARAPVAPAPAAVAAAAPGPALPAGEPEPEALAWFRATWSRLSTAQRLAQSQAALPGNAGPLNAPHLAQRALQLMHDASPATLQHFVAQLDTLWWLDGVNRG